MKLPSIEYLVRNAQVAFVRFPFSLICSFLAAFAAMIVTEFENDAPNILPYVNFMLVAALGISLFFCIDVYSASKEVLRRKRYVYYFLGYHIPDTAVFYISAAPIKF
ncbi:MAG TPA: hypothetical protein VEB86_06620 [Chryseosolibacter sp.]|nr:hypothetical protein [Chryseosolibacter sp.]